MFYELTDDIARSLDELLVREWRSFGLDSLDVDGFFGASNLGFFFGSGETQFFSNSSINSEHS
jgi:hypothetical protein